ncbi:hypothetical protein QBC41DRAFT_348491 [Cercophora samala]|uniref:Uncharacterized protein n=1 Tax=Cercophora samala TaxID=330535 RepID=A0AA39Z9Q4_9PEZI|nr:hypothetical protein QBC41DRAFT_348491 [Cercophora samala]
MKLPSLLLSIIPLSLAQTPPSPGLSYIGRTHISLGTPFPVGPGPFGNRSILPITGGNFTGPIFNATVRAFGGDWALGDPAQGNLYLDARHQLLTEDGADIFVEANGPQQADGVIHCRVRWEAGTDKGYAWLNGVVGVGILTPRFEEGGDGVEGIVVELWGLVTPGEKGLREHWG